MPITKRAPGCVGRSPRDALGRCRRPAHGNARGGGARPRQGPEGPDAVRAFVEKKEMAGAVVAIACKGKVVLFEAFGESEAGGGKAMRTDAIVRIYSMTKPITTVAAMILVEEASSAWTTPCRYTCPSSRRCVSTPGRATGRSRPGVRSPSAT
ncbi:MAG: serine hydrolase domain-containing protein [Gemmataceae bacterium]